MVGNMALGIWVGHDLTVVSSQSRDILRDHTIRDL